MLSVETRVECAELPKSCFDKSVTEFVFLRFVLYSRVAGRERTKPFTVMPVRVAAGLYGTVPLLSFCLLPPPCELPIPMKNMESETQ